MIGMERDESRSRCHLNEFLVLTQKVHYAAGMNIQVAVLCDAATEENLKLSLLGAFDTIGVRALPAVIPRCDVVLRAPFYSSDEGKHVMKLNFVNADGQPIMPPLGFAVDVAMPDDSHFGTR